MSALFHLVRIILHARKKGLLHLRKANAPIRLECIGGECGLCCEVLGGGVVVTEEESVKLGEPSIVRSGRDIKLKSDGFACALLKDKACSCYAVRPQGCHEYPWYQIDGQLFYDAGCPGMKTDKDERPAAHTIKPFNSYLPGLPNFLRRIIRKILLH
ncbi:YkgJ family cysteine cluster protein [bacterium]|nr:YkgJ family cysteine cluster protein [bacterium]